MSENAPAPSTGPGCFPLIGLFLGTALGGLTLAMLLYVLFVEQLGWISVRREFSYEMIFLWAPLTGIVAGVIAAFFAMQRSAPPQRIGFWTGVGFLVALGGLLLFVGLGAIL